ncbi:MAG: ribosomal protein S18-alanine N-acetyltransferase [Roseiarcus sp.]
MLLPFRKLSPPVMRPLRSDKAEQCAALHAASFAHSWSTTEFETLLSSKTTIGGAAVDAATDDLRGFALSRLAGDEAEILTIAVHASFRNRGIGRALLADSLMRLAASHVQSLFLEVERANLPAIALYSRMGFREVGRRRGYYRKPDGAAETALVLRKDLT